MSNIYAILSSLAYIKEDEKKDVIAQSFGYQYNNSFKLDLCFDLNQNYISNCSSVISVFVKDKSVVISIKGTDSSVDLIADLHIINSSRNNDMFKKTLESVKQIVDVYRGFDIVLTGHSLGGSICIYVNEFLRLRTVVFNPGSSPFIKEKKVNDEVIIYRHILDIISSGYLSPANIGNIRTAFNLVGLRQAHSLDNWISWEDMDILNR